MNTALKGVCPPLEDPWHYRSSGHFWQGRYKSFGIQDNDHFLTVARYVEGNPVRAGLVDTALDWVWSSHRGRSMGLAPQVPVPLEPLVTPLPVPFMGDWTDFVNTPMTPTEMAKARKLIARQKGKSEGEQLLH